MVCGKGPSVGKKVKKKLKQAESDVRGGLKKLEKHFATTSGLKGTKAYEDYFMDPIKKMMPEVPEMPVTEAAPVAPGMDEEELRRARRRRNQGGASTILSQGNSDGLGG